MNVCRLPLLTLGREEGCVLHNAQNSHFSFLLYRWNMSCQTRSHPKHKKEGETERQECKCLCIKPSAEETRVNKKNRSFKHHQKTHEREVQGLCSSSNEPWPQSEQANMQTNLMKSYEKPPLPQIPNQCMQTTTSKLLSFFASLLWDPHVHPQQALESVYSQHLWTDTAW